MNNTTMSTLLNIENIVYDKSCQEYNGYQGTLAGCHISFRTAKITPTKIGQFVTLWKREKKGQAIKPLDDKDVFYFVIVFVSKDNFEGCFVFSKTILCHHHVISDGKKSVGKRAVRLYPPWDVTTSKQARLTQQWQLSCFFDHPEQVLAVVAQS